MNALAITTVEPVLPRFTPRILEAPKGDDLLLRLKEGEEEAYEELVREHAGRLLAVARRFLRSDEDSADAVQEAFLSAFRALKSFEGNCALSTWLHRIVVNACLMKLRTRSRRKEGFLEDLLPKFDEPGHHAAAVPRWTEDPHARLASAETRLQVRRAIDRLPEPLRQVLLLRDIEELDTRDTARLLGITPQNVKTRLHRARQALRTLLEPVFARQ